MENIENQVNDSKKESGKGLKIVIGGMAAVVLLATGAIGGYAIANKNINTPNKNEVNQAENNNIESKEKQDENNEDILNLSSANKAFTPAFRNVTYIGYSSNKETMYKVTFDDNCNFTIYSEAVGKQAISTYRSEQFKNIKMLGRMNDTTLMFDYDYQNRTQVGGKGKIFYSEDSYKQARYSNIELSLNIEPSVENVKLQFLEKEQDIVADSNKKEIESGKFIREDTTRRSSGDLEISNVANQSFKFDLFATYTTWSDVDKARQEGGFNIGKVEGIANKISETEYIYETDKKDLLELSWEGEYKIKFIINSDDSINIEEIYDKQLHSEGPFGGANVRFEGKYTK